MLSQYIIWIIFKSSQLTSLTLNTFYLVEIIFIIILIQDMAQ